jgi:hypothetical protein
MSYWSGSLMNPSTVTIFAALMLAVLNARSKPLDEDDGTRFFEREIRPILVEYCYDCHSEAAAERKGGLLLDREEGWLKGGDTENAVVRGEPEASLLIKAIRYGDKNLQMPPKHRLDADQVVKLERWVRMGAPGPLDDMGQTDFSRLGDQKYLSTKAGGHWAFQLVRPVDPPKVDRTEWNENAIDRFVFDDLSKAGIRPSRPADARTLMRRLSFDLSGLPPTPEMVDAFVANPDLPAAVERLLSSNTFGEHVGRLWLDVARYADTDSTYRADTKTPHYYPFAFTYRDYVVKAFNEDKPYDLFIREQLAADRLGLGKDAPELAALGFLTIGPHRRNTDDSIDDWIDVTTRGLLGLTVACARCHDHKFEPIPTADYYALYGVFASITRSDPLDEKKMPLLVNSRANAERRADYERRRAAIEKKIEAVEGKVARNNNRSLAEKIRETELAELLLFHDGAPARAMIVNEARKPYEPFVFVRGEKRSRGEAVSRRFLSVLDPDTRAFNTADSGRLELAERIASRVNPLTARVMVNRIWGFLMGSHLVDTASDFGLQGSAPSHPELLDWLSGDFMDHGWSVKQLVRRIVLSRTYRQDSAHRVEAAAVDAGNRLYWRANRRHLTVESLRDSLLFTSGQLDASAGGRPGLLWGEGYTRRRSVYGYVNRFNQDPTLRAFDFPSSMQSASQRGETIVAPQALFTMNAPFVIDQAVALTRIEAFRRCGTDESRIGWLFRRILQRAPVPNELFKSARFVEGQERFYNDPDERISSPWPLLAQALYMGNEFQYID